MPRPRITKIDLNYVLHAMLRTYRLASFTNVGGGRAVARPYEKQVLRYLTLEFHPLSRIKSALY